MRSPWVLPWMLRPLFLLIYGLMSSPTSDLWSLRCLLKICRCLSESSLPPWTRQEPAKPNVYPFRLRAVLKVGELWQMFPMFNAWCVVLSVKLKLIKHLLLAGSGGKGRGSLQGVCSGFNVLNVMSAKTKIRIDIFHNCLYLFFYLLTAMYFTNIRFLTG